MFPKCPRCGANLEVSVNWEEAKPEFYSSIIRFKHRCRCGNTFEEIYNFVGLWDCDKGKYFWTREDWRK